MARIPPVTGGQLSPALQSAWDKHVKEYNSSIPNPGCTLGHSELAFEVYMQWYPLYDQVKRILGTRLAYLFAYSISKAADCSFCAALFRKTIIEAGENPENLSLTQSQKDLLDFGTGVVKYHGNINDYLYNAVAENYTKADMVTLVAFAGQMVAANIFNNVIEADIDDQLLEWLPPVAGCWQNK